MKQLFILLSFAFVNFASAQGKFFGGNGDGFATATISNIVLPSTGLVFNGVSCRETICLTWSTTQELNSSYFRIERMMPAGQFEMIGRVEAAGTSNEIRNYSFTDKWPLNGINYYRLMQADIDGRYSYSSTISVEHEQKNLAGIVSNFSRDQLSIVVLQPLLPLTLNIFDMQGKLLQRSVHRGSSITVDISNLPGGMYIATIEIKGKKEQHKFIKLY